MNIQEAGPINMIRTLLIILIIYYAARFLMKLFAPYLMKKAISKMQQKAEQQYKNRHSSDTTVNEGETVIDKKPQKTKQSNNSVGEYVDFEELD